MSTGKTVEERGCSRLLVHFMVRHYYSHIEITDSNCTP